MDVLYPLSVSLAAAANNSMLPMRRFSIRRYIFPAILVGAALAWRGGWLPDVVYEGRLRDEIKRRTGFDLADRTSLDGPRIELREVRPVPGPVPAVIVALENTGQKPLNEYRAVAVFRSRWDERGARSVVTYVAGGGQPPLSPGERREVRLSSRAPYDPKTITGKPAGIYADVYLGGAFNSDGTRRVTNSNRQRDALESAMRADALEPDARDVVVRP